MLKSIFKGSNNDENVAGQFANEEIVKKLVKYADGSISAFTAAVCQCESKNGVVELSDVVENIDHVLNRPVRSGFIRCEN